MNVQRDPDAILAAWLEDGPARLPDTTRRAIGVATRSTDQRRRPLWASRRYPFMNSYAKLAAAAVIVLTVGALGFALLGPGLPGIGGQAVPSSSVAPTAIPTSTPATTATPAATASPTPIPSPLAFTSDLYGYSLTLPPGWSAAPARTKWDGKGAPSNDDPRVDRFAGSLTLSAFAFAAPSRLDLNRFTEDVVARNVQFHGDTCPPQPDSVDPTTVGRSAAKFIAWNCGILINIVVVVDHGTGYEFVLRDMAVQAATDAADRTSFDAILSTVTFTK
jgi:hypothetical protein